MYNYDLYLLNLAASKRLEEASRREKLLTPKNKNKRMRAIYKKSLDSMIEASNERQYSARIHDSDRRSETLSREKTDRIRRTKTHMYVPHGEDMSIHEHSFRDRDEGREIGPENGHFSPSTYVPRGFFWGGGKKDKGRSDR